MKKTKKPLGPSFDKTNPKFWVVYASLPEEAKPVEVAKVLVTTTSGASYIEWQRHLPGIKKIAITMAINEELAKK